MRFKELRDPDRLHALIDAMLLIETDAALSSLLQQIVATATVTAVPPTPDARPRATVIGHGDRSRMAVSLTFDAGSDAGKNNRGKTSTAAVA